MPLLSSAIPNLVNGVSQQAGSMRLASQLEAQENALSSVVEGLGKRPPSKHVKRLGVDDISTAHIHLINRSPTERYEVVLTDGDLRVFDLATGAQKTVAFPNGKTYLNASAPRTSMRALTVEDHTFILNTTKVAAMDVLTSPSNLGKALISIKQGQYGTKYSIKLEGNLVASYSTSSTSIDDIQTVNIANKLMNNFGLPTKPYVTAASYVGSSKRLTQAGRFSGYSWTAGDMITLTGGTSVKPGDYEVAARIDNDTIELAAHPTRFGGPSPVLYNSPFGDISSPIPSTDIGETYSVSRAGSTLLIEKLSGTAIDCTVEDTFGNRAMTVATDQVQQFSDLPTVAPANFVVKVTGGTGSTEDDYYVKFLPITETGVFGNGTWIETVGPSVVTNLLTTSLPHILVREGDGTFTFKVATWGERGAGDAESAPNPSFVGSTLTDLFLFRNRLGILSQASVVMSVAGSPFNFFAQSVTTILDSDPIDLDAPGEASTLRHAVPFREELLLFSDKAQYVLKSNNSALLTAASVSIEQTTQFEASLQARPVGAGSNVYFAFSRGSRFSGVKEYFIQPDSESKDAADITAHVPKYIQGAISRLTAATNEDVLVALSDGAQDGLYVYKYYWVGDQKVQSSWSHFSYEADCKVLSADFIDSDLHQIIQRDDGFHLEVLSFEPGQSDEDSEFVTLLDRRVDETQIPGASYNPSTDRTTFTLPYEITGDMQVVIRAGDALPEGKAVSIIATAGDEMVVSGDHLESRVYIGQRYEMVVELSEPVLREEAPGGGQATVVAGRLQVRRYILSFARTGFFTTSVTPTGRATSTKVFSGLIPGVTGLGAVHLRDGAFPFSVFAKANEFRAIIRNPSFMPCFFTGAEFEAHFTSRSQRA